MGLTVELIGVGKEGFRSTVIFEYDESMSVDEVSEAEGSFKGSYNNVFIANVPNYDMCTLLISVEDDLVFKDTVSTVKEYDISPMSKGADLLIELGYKFILPTKTKIVYQ